MKSIAMRRRVKVSGLLTLIFVLSATAAFAYSQSSGWITVKVGLTNGPCLRARADITDENSTYFITGHGTQTQSLYNGSCTGYYYHNANHLRATGYVQRYDNANSQYITCNTAPTHFNSTQLYQIYVGWEWVRAGCSVSDYYYGTTLSQAENSNDGNVGGFFSGYVKSNSSGAGNGLYLVNGEP